MRGSSAEDRSQYNGRRGGIPGQDPPNHRGVPLYRTQELLQFRRLMSPSAGVPTRATQVRQTRYKLQMIQDWGIDRATNILGQNRIGAEALNIHFVPIRTDFNLPRIISSHRGRTEPAR